MKTLALITTGSLFLLLSFVANHVSGASQDKTDPQPITITNYTGGETIRYPVPIIRGTLADKNLTSVEVVNESSDRDTATMAGLAYKGSFKALTELVPGKNRIIVKAGDDPIIWLKITLMYGELI